MYNFKRTTKNEIIDSSESAITKKAAMDMNTKSAMDLNINKQKKMSKSILN